MEQEFKVNSVGWNWFGELILKIHGLVVHDVAEERLGWHSTSLTYHI